MAAKKKADAAVENTAEVTQETVQEEIEQVTEENAKELDNKKYVVDHLLSTKREGMEDLIAYMEEIGFFEAPCSGGNHLACQFGLVHHSRNVMMAAENIGYALLGKVKYAEIRDSVIIAAALQFEYHISLHHSQTSNSKMKCHHSHKIQVLKLLGCYISHPSLSIIYLVTPSMQSLAQVSINKS